MSRIEGLSKIYTASSDAYAHTLAESEPKNNEQIEYAS